MNPQSTYDDLGREVDPDYFRVSARSKAHLTSVGSGRTLCGIPTLGDAIPRRGVDVCKLCTRIVSRFERRSNPDA